MATSPEFHIGCRLGPKLFTLLTYSLNTVGKTQKKKFNYLSCLHFPFTGAPNLVVVTMTFTKEYVSTKCSAYLQLTLIDLMNHLPTVIYTLQSFNSRLFICPWKRCQNKRMPQKHKLIAYRKITSGCTFQEQQPWNWKRRKTVNSLSGGYIFFYKNCILNLIKSIYITHRKITFFLGIFSLIIYSDGYCKFNLNSHVTSLPSSPCVHMHLLSSDWERHLWSSKYFYWVSACLCVPFLWRSLHFSVSFPFPFLYFVLILVSYVEHHPPRTIGLHI